MAAESPRWPRWLAILKIAKVPFWFTWMTPAIFAYIASAEHAGAYRDLGWFALSVLGICAFQTLGCIHNELVDQPEDRVNQPARASLIDSVGERTLWRITVTGYAACFLGLVPFAIFVGPTTAAIMGLGCLAGPLYNWGPRLKRHPGLAEFAIGWTAFSIYLYAWTFNASVLDVSPVIWVLTYFFAVTCFVKDLPDVEGDEAVGAAGIFSIRGRLARAAALLFIYFSPYVLVVALVAAGVLPLRFLAMLVLAGAGVLVMVFGERASSHDAAIVVYELAFLYVQLFFLALLLLDVSTTAAIVAAVLLFVARLIAVGLGLEPRFVDDDFSWRRSLRAAARATT
jgi:4-hydroxybenzoate polyprenyltransferase